MDLTIRAYSTGITISCKKGDLTHTNLFLTDDKVIGFCPSPVLLNLLGVEKRTISITEILRFYEINFTDINNIIYQLVLNDISLDTIFYKSGDIFI